METPISHHKTSNEYSSCTSVMENYFVRNIYGPTHLHQMEYDYHLVIMMTHTYAPLLLVEG